MGTSINTMENVLSIRPEKEVLVVCRIHQHVQHVAGPRAVNLFPIVQSELFVRVLVLSSCVNRPTRPDIKVIKLGVDQPVFYRGEHTAGSVVFEDTLIVGGVKQIAGRIEDEAMIVKPADQT